MGRGRQNIIVHHRNAYELGSGKTACYYPNISGKSWPNKHRVKKRIKGPMRILGKNEILDHEWILDADTNYWIKRGQGWTKTDSLWFDQKGNLIKKGKSSPTNRELDKHYDIFFANKKPGGNSSPDYDNTSGETVPNGNGAVVGGLSPEEVIVKKILPDSKYHKESTQKQWIVIHNTAGCSTTEQVYNTFLANTNRVCTHYSVSDDSVIQMLDDQYWGNHAQTPGVGGGPAWSLGARNSNSIGIEMCECSPCNYEASYNNAIELSRYLMQKHGIPVDHVIRHYDVKKKICPWTMMDEGSYSRETSNGEKKGQSMRWDNFKATIAQRNADGVPITLCGQIVGGGMGTALPNFDNREDWEWTESWDGVLLEFVYPRNYTNDVPEDEADYERWNGEAGTEFRYNYVVDKEEFKETVNPNYICNSMEDNDKNTYIQNALFTMNRAIKHTVSVCMFVDPDKPDTWPDVESNAISCIAQILYKTGLDTSDLWREFDMNRFGSPFIFLERKVWKQFLDQVDEQLQWRLEQWGEPEFIPTPWGPPPKPDPNQQNNLGGYLAYGTDICASFTGYCPFDGKDPTGGGHHGINNYELVPGSYSLAIPGEYANKLFGKQAMIYGTGVPEIDGRVVEIRDTGGAIDILAENIWDVDVLSPSSDWANQFLGHIPGYLRVGADLSGFKYKPADQPAPMGGIGAGGGTGVITTPLSTNVMSISENEYCPLIQTFDNEDDNEGDSDEENEDEFYDPSAEDAITERDVKDPEHYFEIVPLEDEIKEHDGQKPPETKPVLPYEAKEKDEDANDYLGFKNIIEKYGSDAFSDIYTMKFEPWDKDIESIRMSFVTDDSRFEALDKVQDTRNENTFRYNVVESGPGAAGEVGQTVSPAAELNILARPDPVMVDPVYPDLTVIPNSATSDYNTTNTTKIPFHLLNDKSTISEAGALTNGKLSYDYETLKNKKKTSKGKPINYNDPYPFDDRIHDLESHYPKVKIDEIELKLYECNHPGCPIAQPMAKSIAAMAEAHLTQSKKLERRLCRIENTLSTITRNFGRLAARINVN